MKTVLETAKDLKELARFLGELNSQKSFHIGYCGEKVGEIHKTLEEDFVQENGQSSFYIARDSDGEIMAAIGLDIDEDSAEVWGPFNRASSLYVQNLVWDSLLQEFPTIETFYFFLNKENQKQRGFMETIHATKTGKHLILEITKQNFMAVQDIKSTQFSRSDFPAFKDLHETAFPNTYYNAEAIRNGLNDECNLKILKTESNEILGYAYYEVDLEMGEAALHYLAISPSAQNRGYGTMLLKEVITEMFNFTQISEIRLCVDLKNDQANHIYYKAGFDEKDVLFSYRLERKDRQRRVK